MLRQQYTLVRTARTALLDFIETSVAEDTHQPFPAYAGKSIRDLLQHNADCYFDWLGYFALGQPHRSSHVRPLTTLPQLRQYYAEVDELVTVFLDKFEGSVNTPIKSRPDPQGPFVTATPLQIFTQCTTHEFHHKGQIVFMSRLLGHIPPETDAALAF